MQCVSIEHWGAIVDRFDTIHYLEVHLQSLSARQKQRQSACYHFMCNLVLCWKVVLISFPTYSFHQGLTLHETPGELSHTGIMYHDGQERRQHPQKTLQCQLQIKLHKSAELLSPLKSVHLACRAGLVLIKILIWVRYLPQNYNYCTSLIRISRKTSLQAWPAGMGAGIYLQTCMHAYICNR